MDKDQRSQEEWARFAGDIEQQARTLIESHAHFCGRGRRFEFHYREEVLTVRGSVPSFYLKQVLQSVLSNLDGVRLIANEVSVHSTETLTGGSRG